MAASNRMLHLPQRTPIGFRSLQEPAIAPGDFILFIPRQPQERLIGENDRVVGLCGIANDHRALAGFHGREK